LNNVFLSNNFIFNTHVMEKNHYTDNRKGSPMHYLAYMEEGESRIVSDSIIIEIKKGDAFYIPKNLPYQSYWKSDGKIKFKSYGFEYFPEINHKGFVLQKLDCTDEMLERIKNIPTITEVTSKLVGEFYSVLAELLPNMSFNQYGTDKAVVQKAKGFIYKSPYYKMDDVATHCLISTSALYKIFKKETETTPNDFKRKVLCERAVFMLSTTDKSVQEISDKLGFSSTSYFRKEMKRFYGKTPREIRKQSIQL